RPPLEGPMGAGCGDHLGGPPDFDGGFPSRPPPPPLPDSSAIAACHDALTACLVAQTEDPASCFLTEHQCVGDAFRAAFQQRCDDAQAACASSSSTLSA